MKVSEAWLREWINPTISLEQIGEQLTMLGLELESIDSVAAPCEKVVVGEVVSTEKHPNADKLTVCQVNVGEASLNQVICGAQNVREGLKVAVCLVGAVLGGDFKIKKAKMRGVESHGMICSASELGLEKESEGIIELPADAPVGKDIREYLQLDDRVIDFSITPNRGDCLSVWGIAREVAIANQMAVNTPNFPEIKPTNDAMRDVEIDEVGCTHYVGRVVEGINPDAQTPLWMKERLRRSGIRHISLPVDVCNYVMIAMGQPMHAFDLDKLSGDIAVRFARKGESIKVLDETVCELSETALIIADDTGPQALAGIMGGFDSGVTTGTQNIFLESAYFNPDVIARTLRDTGYHSDSAFRFERGVNPACQREAIEWATQLIIEIAGGSAGPVLAASADAHPIQKEIPLRLTRLAQIAGAVINEKTVKQSLEGLSFSVKAKKDTWNITVPAYRHDITREIDLIEEVLRIVGYDNLPTKLLEGAVKPLKAMVEGIDPRTVMQSLIARGYHEVISYSFVNPKIQSQVTPDDPGLMLSNPMTSEMAVMRTTLWPGLLEVLDYNRHRQVTRLKVCESGLRFRQDGKQQEHVIAGLLWGDPQPEQWGVSKRDPDFYDIKTDVEALCGNVPVQFEPSEHPALHPGQSAALMLNDQCIGWVGKVHPGLADKNGWPRQLFLFECLTDPLMLAAREHYRAISRYPHIRRDIAVWVEDSVSTQQIQEVIRKAAGEHLTTLELFDYYKDKSANNNKKSLALALTLQHPSRTLVDIEVSKIMDKVFSALEAHCDAELRE